MLIKRRESYVNWINSEMRRNIRFLLNPKKLEVREPDSWQQDKKFNPYYVLSHSAPIAMSIVRKLRRDAYKPNPPFVRRIPKAGGGERDVCEFQIPDSTVSDLYYRKLLEKNRHRFSGYAYAYRDDRNVHFAIQELRVSLQHKHRLFIAEYDFSKFFDSIDHQYLDGQLSSNGLLIAQHERGVINAFLSESKIRGKGIPQGSSISLFLANVACCGLDRKLEEIGVRFARYADDTIIWSENYDQVCRAVDALSEFSQDSGILINQKKSDGISLLTTKDVRSELASHKNFINFLGYRLSPESVGIKDASVERIKVKISTIIKRCMIDPSRTGQGKPVVVPANNRDDGLMIAACMVRRYMYGNLQEEYLRGFLSGKYSHLSFLGLMSFYPLVDDEIQLIDLDRWLLHSFHRAALLRYRQFAQQPSFAPASSVIFNTPSSSDFLKNCHAQVVNGKRLYSIPSFLRISRAISKRITNDGVIAAMHPKSKKYNYSTP